MTTCGTCCRHAIAAGGTQACWTSLRACTHPRRNTRFHAIVFTPCLIVPVFTLSSYTNSNQRTGVHGFMLISSELSRANALCKITLEVNFHDLSYPL